MSWLPRWLGHFPSFSEGLSLRATTEKTSEPGRTKFPFLFGGTFIEGGKIIADAVNIINFPSFSEGLSLRVVLEFGVDERKEISLPFRRDFH